MDFDGSNDYIQIADSDTLSGTDGFSISLWVNTDNFTDKRLFGKGSNSAYELLSETTNDKPRWRIHDGSTTTIEGATALSDGTWYNLIAVYDPTSSEMRLYVNGALDASGSIGSISTTTDPLYFGRNNSGNYFDGQIDEVYFFGGKAITDAEALSIYNAGLAGNQLSSAIVSTSGAGTYLIDESGVHDAVLSDCDMVPCSQLDDFSSDLGWTDTRKPSLQTVGHSQFCIAGVDTTNNYLTVSSNSVGGQMTGATGSLQ